MIAPERAFAPVLLLPLSLLFITSCNKSEPEPYIEPAWMSEARSDVSEYSSAMFSCLEDQGAEPEIAGGGEVLVGGTADSTGNLPPEVEEINSAASAYCAELVSPPELWTRPADHIAYTQMLDVRACLADQGFKTPEPPKEDRWLADIQNGGAVYAPFYYVIGPNSSISDEDLASLMYTCQQSGYGRVVVALGDDA